MAIEYVTSPQKVIPSAASAVTVTPSSTSYAWSAWHELTSSAPSDLILTGVRFAPPSAWYEGLGCYVQVGAGGAGAETVIATVLFFHGGYQCHRPVSWRMLPVPYGTISSGTRLAVRMAKYGSQTDTWSAALTYYEAPATGVLTTTTSVLTTLPASGAWAAPTLSGTADVYGSWVELSSGLGSDVAIGLVAAQSQWSGPTGIWTAQVGTGGAGTEVPIVTWSFRYDNAWGGAYEPGVVLCRPLVTVAASTRLAVRVKSSGTGSGTYVAAIAYYTLPL